MSLFRQDAAAAWLLVAVAVYAGCGKRTNNITVTGSVVRNGQPLSLSKNGYVQVTIRPDVDPGKAFTPRIAECDKTNGKFEIRDVPTGKYKVGIQQFDPDPTTDKLKGAFYVDTGKTSAISTAKRRLILIWPSRSEVSR
jgi:hypothetical protein